MGRKKKGNAKPKKDEAQEAINELKESFLDLCGVVSWSDDDASKTKLIEDLTNLQRTDPEDYERVETIATQLRESRDDFLQYLYLEREEVMYVYRDLQDKYDPNAVHDLVTLETIYRSYLIQVSEEEAMLDNVLKFLDNLYASSNDSRQLGVWIVELAHRHRMKNRSWLAILKPKASSPAASKEAEYPVVDLVKPDMLSTESAPYHATLKIVDAAKHFLESSSINCMKLLVVGPQGSGKTHLCDEIESMTRKVQGIDVIRPKIPIDFMGARVGEAESCLSELFAAIATSAKSVVIMDDLNSLISTNDDERSALEIRLKHCLLSRLDQLSRSNVLFVCSSSSPLDDEVGRFDKTFALQLPDRDDRLEMIKSCLRISDECQDEEIKHALETLTVCMLGLSRAEIARFCRTSLVGELQAGNGCDTDQGKLNVLKSMVLELRQLAPESLRSGVVDGFVDMKVMTATDLESSPMNDGEPSLPLFGEDMKDAWRQVEALVVTPLCRADALDRILSGKSGASRRSFCGGVILTGPPGTGKTALATHAARVAARFLPSVKLLDVSCTSLVHKEVGGSERALRRLFAAVRAASPCILLMDGIENIAAVRGNDSTTHGTMDRILSTLLTELDGINTTSSPTKEGAKFSMIGITHNVSWIDAALCRPGRLERVVQLQKPDREARIQVALREFEEQDFNVWSDSANFHEVASRIADRTEGKTAAEIRSLFADARMAAAKELINTQGVVKALGSSQPTFEPRHFRSIFADT